LVDREREREREKKKQRKFDDSDSQGTPGSDTGMEIFNDTNSPEDAAQTSQAEPQDNSEKASAVVQRSEGKFLQEAIDSNGAHGQEEDDPACLYVCGAPVSGNRVN
jgi:hypothetical protein